MAHLEMIEIWTYEEHIHSYLDFLLTPFESTWRLAFLRVSHLPQPASWISSVVIKSLTRNFRDSQVSKAQSIQPKRRRQVVNTNQMTAKIAPAATPTQTCFGV